MNIFKKNKKIFWGGIIGLAFLYVGVKYSFPAVLRWSLDQGRMRVLNLICAVDCPRNYFFYFGRLQDLMVGPFLQMVSIFAFTLVSLRCFRKASKGKYALAVFFFLLITKWEALFFPCYGEMGAGPLAEASWLYRNNFDYVRLLSEKNFSMGGPKVYMFSVYPTLVAGLLRLSPSVGFFLTIYHLLMFGLGAMVISLFRSLLQQVTDKTTAIWTSLVLLALPLFQSMVELVNMETLCLFFVVWTAYFLSVKRIFLAGIMALLAAFAKGPGGIACGAVLAVSLLRLVCEPQKKARVMELAWGMAVFSLGLLNLYLLRRYISPQQMPAGTISFFVGWPPLSESRILLGFVSLSLAGFLVAFIREGKQGGLRIFLERYYIYFLALVFVMGWIGLYLNVSVLGPRYKLILMPFLILSVFCSVMVFVHNKKVLRGFLAFAIFMCALGSYGLFYPQKILSATYSFNHLERTLEYRNDLYLKMMLARTLAGDYAGYTVGAPFVIAQVLALPELGYVDHPFEVVIYGMRVFYGGIKNFDGLTQLDLRRTIWVGFEHEDLNPHIKYPFDPQMDILRQALEVGDKRMLLFQGGFAVERMRRIVAYVNRLE